MDDLIIFYVVSYNKKILLLGFENVIEVAIKSKNKKEKKFNLLCNFLCGNFHILKGTTKILM